MKTLIRTILLAVAPLVVGASAEAQISCSECDPYSYCGTSCWYCSGGPEQQDGSCGWQYVAYTTCDEAIGACTEYGCTPNWVTTERVTVGTYGETTYGVLCNPFCQPTFGCDHHNVDRVTQHDNNECNINSSYNNKTYCHDYVNASRPHQTGSIPNCCASWLFGPQYTCNDWHSCF